MATVVDRLVELGLSQYESKAYVALLRDYPANPYQISKKGGVPTSKIYEIVNRLEERGLVAKVAGEDGGYVPKEPEVALAEWRDKYLRTLQETTRELQAAMSGRPVCVVWNIEGDDEVIGQGRRLLDSAERTVSLAASGALVEAWAPQLRAAGTRGVYLNLIAYDDLSEANADLPVHLLKAPDGKNGKRGSAAMAVDKRVGLFVSAHPEGTGLQGAWTNNPAIAAIAEEYVDDKLFLERAIANRWISWGETG